MTDTPEQIAAKLTEAQRSVMLTGDCSREGNDGCVCQSPLRAGLADMGLVKHGPVYNGWLVTDLGLQVRVILQGDLP